MSAKRRSVGGIAQPWNRQDGPLLRVEHPRLGLVHLRGYGFTEVSAPYSSDALDLFKADGSPHCLPLSDENHGAGSEAEVRRPASRWLVANDVSDVIREVANALPIQFARLRTHLTGTMDGGAACETQNSTSGLSPIPTVRPGWPVLPGLSAPDPSRVGQWYRAGSQVAGATEATPPSGLVGRRLPSRTATGICPSPPKRGTGGSGAVAAGQLH